MSTEHEDFFFTGTATTQLAVRAGPACKTTRLVGSAAS
jgi:hypothetical protein